MKYPLNRLSIASAVTARLARRWSQLRWLPFALAAASSVAMAALAPDGRRPFQFEWTLSLAALLSSLNEGAHVGASALLALLAVVATGRRRLAMAFCLTMLISAAWELAQASVTGHHARMSALASGAFGALLGCGWGACMMWLTEPQHRTSSRRQPAPW